MIPEPHPTSQDLAASLSAKHKDTEQIYKAVKNNFGEILRQKKDISVFIKCSKSWDNEYVSANAN